jgi:hypothetical protein
MKRTPRVVEALLVLVSFAAASSSRADSLLIEGPQTLWFAWGSDLLIVNRSVSLNADGHTQEATDGIRRFGFEALYWDWQISFDGALAEGWGYCVLRSGGPDARLHCD